MTLSLPAGSLVVTFMSWEMLRLGESLPLLQYARPDSVQHFSQVPSPSSPPLLPIKSIPSPFFSAVGNTNCPRSSKDDFLFRLETTLFLANNDRRRRSHLPAGSSRSLKSKDKPPPPSKSPAFCILSSQTEVPFLSLRAHLPSCSR